MEIFISHALVDKEIAEKVKLLLSSVSLGLIEPWLSSSLDGLKPGDVLWDEIHEKLGKSDKIITILTPNSYLRPWLLYESGYVAGSKGANVIPLVFSITKSDLPSPLSAYVIYAADNEEDLTKLLIQILNEAVPSPDIESITKKSRQFIKEIKKVIDKWSKTEEPDEDIKLIDKDKASEILHRKLLDPNVKKVTIITYTNERLSEKSLTPVKLLYCLH
jgi:TIR domain